MHSEMHEKLLVLDINPVPVLHVLSKKAKHCVSNVDLADDHHHECMLRRMVPVHDINPVPVLQALSQKAKHCTSNVDLADDHHHECILRCKKGSGT